MFTGIISDIGEVAAREGGRFAIRCGYPAESIAIGASIACDGACLTATAVAPAGRGSLFTVDVSNETLCQDHAGRLAAGPPHQPGAGAEGRRRAGRAYRGGARRRRRPHRRHRGPTANRRRFTVEVPRAAGPLHRPQGLGGARRHLAHRQRGAGAPLRHQYHPAHLDPHDLGAQKAGRPGQPRSRRVRALRGAA